MRTRKTCCCCGGETEAPFEQYWNRDFGFGLCESCIDFCGEGETPGSFKETYGEPSIHYSRLPKAFGENTQ